MYVLINLFLWKVSFFTALGVGTMDRKTDLDRFSLPYSPKQSSIFRMTSRVLGVPASLPLGILWGFWALGPALAYTDGA